MTVAARCGAAGCWSCIVTVAVDVAAVVVVQVVVAAAAVVAVDVSVDVTVEVAVEVPRGGGRGDCRGIGRGGGQPPRRPLRRPWPWLLAALHIIHYMLVGSSVGAQTVLVCQDNHQENWSHRSPLVGTCQMSLHTPPSLPIFFSNKERALYDSSFFMYYVSTCVRADRHTLNLLVWIVR